MNKDVIKIATLNLCLGLKNKKEEVKRLIIENKIDVLCLKEKKIPNNFPVNKLTFSGYNYECECNDVKLRCGIYIANNISYVRRNDIEINNIHVMVIDLNDPPKTILINVYRSFNPNSNITQKELFDAQILAISNLLPPNAIIMGDFNLDCRKRFDINYSHKNCFTVLNTFLQDNNLAQIVNFDTW